MATFTIIPQATRGDFSYGFPGDQTPTPFAVPAGVAKTVKMQLRTSVPWPTTPGLSWAFRHWRSFDNGDTWHDMSQDSFLSGTGIIGRDGTGLPAIGVAWDGSAMLVRVKALAPVPFDWGVDVTF